MEKEQPDIFSINSSELIDDSDVEQIERYEENEDIYKWLSLLLVFIWAVSLMVF